MSAHHTPGEWVRDTTSGIKCDVRSTNGRAVALCWGLSTSKAARNNSQKYQTECDANARLIAEAGTVTNETGLTPRKLADERDKLKALNAELVAALQSILKRSKESGYLFKDSGEFYAAKALIVKATGESA